MRARALICLRPLVLFHYPVPLPGLLGFDPFHRALSRACHLPRSTTLPRTLALSFSMCFPSILTWGLLGLFLNPERFGGVYARWSPHLKDSKDVLRRLSFSSAPDRVEMKQDSKHSAQFAPADMPVSAVSVQSSDGAERPQFREPSPDFSGCAAAM